ncbi:MAG: hypothetical protein AAFQ94_21935, partial [Bacteroidota bacterium]
MNTLRILFTAIAVCSIINVSFSQTGNYWAGPGAGNDNSSALSWVTFVGYKAGDINLGSSNSFFGSEAGLKNTTGNLNSFFGHRSGWRTTTGSENAFFGSSTGLNNTTGRNNSIFGYKAGISTYGGSYNAYFGGSAGKGSGSNNVAIGYSAGGSQLVYLDGSPTVSHGSNNVSIGYNAGGTGSGNVFLGANTGRGQAVSNKLFIDNSNTSTPLILGDFSSNQLGINSALRSGYTLSVGGPIYASSSLSVRASIYTEGNLKIGSNTYSAYIDDDDHWGGNSDDWLRLNGYIEMKSNTDSYGIVLRDKDNTAYLGITQKDGWSYFADSNTSGNYFLRGNGANAEVRGTFSAGGNITAPNLKTSDWNAAFAQRGSVIAGNGLDWSAGKLVINPDEISANINYIQKSGSHLYHTGGFLGIGISNPTAALHITTTTKDSTPNIAGTQITSGSIELTRNNATPYIDFQNDISGIDFDARLSLTNSDEMSISGANLSLNDWELRNTRAIQLKDWDDNSGGSDYKYRILARDGAFQVYNGGLVVGSYANNTWTDLPDGNLIVESKVGIGTTSPTKSLDVVGDIRTSAWLYSKGDFGLYNETDGTHFYSDDANFWRFRSDRGFRLANKSNVIKGYLYHDNNQSFGLLDADGNWSHRIVRDQFTAFHIDNSEKMRILNSGRVGIGTVSPTSQLEVVGAITATGGNSDQWNLAFDQRGEMIAGNGLDWDGSQLNFNPGTSDWAFNNKNLTGINHIQINDAGENEGIEWGGTGNGAKIFVSPLNGGTTDGYLRFINDDGLSFEGGVQNREDMVITPAGNVGIGMSDPQEKLHINGSIRGNGHGQSLRIRTSTGYTDVGSASDTWSHFLTDRPRFFFNKGITVDQGLIGSFDEDLQLQTSGVSAIRISKLNQQVNVLTNLEVGGELKLTPANVAPDNNPDDLLVMRTDGTVAKRSVKSIESPWLFEKIFVGQDSLAVICPDSTVLGNVFVDVIDLNGNIKIGDDAYIDDDLIAGDNDGEPDDWMKFSERIEFKSAADKHGIVLFDKTNFLNYLNLHQSGDQSFLSNSANADQFFMKSIGRDVEFGGKVSIPELSTTNYVSNESLRLSFDRDNNSESTDKFSIGVNGAFGGPNYKELLKLEENGSLYLSELTKDSLQAHSTVLVRDPLSGKILGRDGNTLGRWSQATGGISYNGGNIGVGIFDAPTEGIDVGSGTIKVRNLPASNIETGLVVADVNGRFHRRDLSTINLSPWTKQTNALTYAGGVSIGSDSAPESTLDVAGDLKTDQLQVAALTQNNGLGNVLVADAIGNFHTRSITSFVNGTDNSLNSLVVSDAGGNLYKRSLSSLIGSENNNLNELVVKDSNGNLHSRSINSLVSKLNNDGVQIVVRDSVDGFAYRELNTINLSPWSSNINGLNYQSNVGIGLLTDELPTERLDIRGTARLRNIPVNDLASNVLVTDDNGVIQQRSIDSFTPWKKYAENNFYTSAGQVGIGIQNLSDDVTMVMQGDRRVGMLVKNTYDQPGSYGIISEVASDTTKALAVINSAGSNDVFRVYGNGIVEARQVLVAQEIWHDDVFKPGFDLRSIEEVEAFVNKNHHLPDVPSEKEVLENG